MNAKAAGIVPCRFISQLEFLFLFIPVRPGVAHLLRETLDELALLFGELLGDLDRNVDEHIALIRRIELLYAEPLHAEGLLALRSLGDGELVILLERGHLHLAAKYSGSDGDGDALVDIRAVAQEALMRFDPDGYQHVAAAAAPVAVVAAAVDAHGLPVVYACGDLYLALDDIPDPARAAAGLAGILTVARATSAQPTYGQGYEMDAIGACFIGGASAYGGIGTVPGVIIGALLTGVINQGMSLMGIEANWQKVVKGVVLLGAVIFDVLSKNEKK